MNLLLAFDSAAKDPERATIAILVAQGGELKCGQAPPPDLERRAQTWLDEQTGRASSGAGR